MSKNFGAIGIVASFVCVCMFLAAIPVQADVVIPTLEYGYQSTQAEGIWINAAWANYGINETYTGWKGEGDTVSSDSYFAYPKASNRAGDGDMSHVAYFNRNVQSNKWTDETRVALKLEVEGGSLQEFLKNVKFFTLIPNENDGGTLDSPSVSAVEFGAMNSSVMESPATTGTEGSATVYLYGLEEELLKGELKIRFDSSLFDSENTYNPIMRYVATLQVLEAPVDGSVPEPATLAVFGLGLLGTGLVAGRKRNMK